MFNDTFQDRIKGSSVKELQALLADLKGKDGRVAEILRKNALRALKSKL